MYLLDTHVFIWLVSDPEKLSPTARSALESSKTQVAVSLVTAWEVALLFKRGRLHLPLGPRDYMERAIQHHRIQEIALDRAIILNAVDLPDIHNDPFDRILVATALQSRIPLISKDQKISQYPDVEIIW